MKRRNKIAIALTAVMMGLFGNAMAAEESGVAEVSTSILPSCKLSVIESISMQYNPSQSTLQSMNFSVHCTKTTRYQFGVNLGNNGVGTVVRNMIAGENKLRYNLYNPSNAILGDIGKPNSVYATSTGDNKNYSLRVLVQANQYVPAGTYVDELILTLVY